MKIGMLFPGYGSQFVGMAKELYDHSRTIQEYFEEASNCLSVNFVKLCFASSDAELSKITHAYPALLLVSVAVAAYIKETGLTLELVAGHGIGEYSALCSAKGISFPDGLYLLTKLAQFYTETREHLDVKSLLIDGLSSRALKKICKACSSVDSGAQIAVYETKTEHIVSGHSAAVEAVAHTAHDAGADKVRELKLEQAWHTPLLADLVKQLTVYLTKVDFKDVDTALITNVDARPANNAKQVQSAVMRQIVEPLYWHDVLKYFASMDLILIPAPSKALVREVQAYYPEKRVLGIETVADFEALKQLLATAPVVLPVEQVVEKTAT